MHSKTDVVCNYVVCKYKTYLSAAHSAPLQNYSDYVSYHSGRARSYMNSRDCASRYCVIITEVREVYGNATRVRRNFLDNKRSIKLGHR